MQASQTELSKKLFGNVGLNFAAQAILLLLNFATAPYIVHKLGIELFAVVALVQAVAGFSGVLNLGLGRALTKYISECYWKADTRKINEFFQTAWAISIVLGLFGMLALGTQSETAALLFFHDKSEIDVSIIMFAVYVAAVGLFSSMMLDTISAIPTAAQRFGIKSTIQVAMGTLWTVGSVALLHGGYSIRAILILNLASNLVGLALFTAASRRLIRGLSFLPYIHWASLKVLLTFSFPLILSAVCVLVVVRLDRFLLAYFLPLSAVTFYTLPASLAEKLSLAVSNVSSVVFPFASELHSRNASKNVQELYIRSTKIVILMTIPITVVFLAIPDPVLRFWLGAEYAERGSDCLSLLSLGALLNALSAVPTVTSLGIGRAWLPSTVAFIVSAVSLMANVFLIPRYGIVGAAWAFLGSQLIVIPFVYSINRTLNLPTSRLLLEALLRPFICALLQFFVLYGSSRYIHDLFSLILVSTASLLFFGLVSFFFALERSERVILMNALSPVVMFWKLLLKRFV